MLSGSEASGATISEHGILDASLPLSMTYLRRFLFTIMRQERNGCMASQSYEQVDRAIERVTPVIERIACEVWQFAELSLAEVRSARLLLDILREQGFTITSRGTAGVPTAFIAEYGSGEPVIGFLAEYDALPGLGNEAVPYREPRRDLVTSGHGCGHNLLGAGCVGAALALKEVMAEQQIPGTIRLYGCAAEETEGAKVYMAREGLFRDLAAALHWHPGPLARVSNYRSTAVDQLQIEFFGKSSHAASAPSTSRLVWPLTSCRIMPGYVSTCVTLIAHMLRLQRPGSSRSSRARPWRRRRRGRLLSIRASTTCCQTLRWPSACRFTWNGLAFPPTPKRSRLSPESFSRASAWRQKA